MTIARMLRLGLASLLVFTPIASQAETFGYSPTYNDLAVGKGVTGIDFGNPQPACIDFKTQPLTRSLGYTKVSIIYNQTDLAQALSIDSKASVGIFGQSGSGYLNVASSTTNNDIAFTIVIEAIQQTNGTTMASVPTWKAPYDSYIAQGKIEEVRKDCGDRYIQSENDDARLYAVINVRQEASNYHLNVATGGSANFNASVATVSASLGAVEDFKKAVQNDAISVNVFYQGINGLQDASHLVSISPNDSISDIQSKIVAALSSANITGQPASYDLTPYPGMPLVASLDDTTSKFLSDIKQAYSFGNFQSSNISCLVTSCDARSSLLNAPDRALVVSYNTAFNSYLNYLKTVFTNCADEYFRDATKCDKGLMPVAPAAPDVVELIPIGAPVWGSIEVLVDNAHWLDPGQVSAILKQNSSLLDATRAIFPGANSVDVYADVLSPYFSVGQTIVPGHLAIYGASDVQTIAKPDEAAMKAQSDYMRMQTQTAVFGPPPGSSTVVANNNLVPLLHADQANPCNQQPAVSVLGKNVQTYDSVCFSPVARRIASSFANNAMALVNSACAQYRGQLAYGPAGLHKVNLSEPLFSKLSSQFGTSSQLPYGFYGVEFVSNGGACGYHYAMAVSDFGGDSINLSAASGLQH